LTRIVVNAALMRLRHSRHRIQPVDTSDDASDLLAETVADWRPDPEQIYSRTELQQILIRALESLPDRYRLIFILRDMQGFSIDETAEMLGLRPTTIKTRLLRARLLLRKKLGRFFRAPAGSRMSTDALDLQM